MTDYDHDNGENDHDDGEDDHDDGEDDHDDDDDDHDDGVLPANEVLHQEASKTTPSCRLGEKMSIDFSLTSENENQSIFPWPRMYIGVCKNCICQWEAQTFLSSSAPSR